MNSESSVGRGTPTFFVNGVVEMSFGMGTFVKQ
jgi:hypothetical protein